MTAVLLECGHAVTEVVEIGGEHRCGTCASEAVIDSEPVEETAEGLVGTAPETEPGTLKHRSQAQAHEGEERQDGAENSPPQPVYGTRGTEPGPRGCWAVKKDGTPCGAVKRRDGDYCTAHSGLGVASDPSRYSPLAHEARRRQLEARAQLRLVLGDRGRMSARTVLREKANLNAERLAGRAINAALSPEVDDAKAAGLALSIIREAEPRESSTLTVTAEQAVEDMSMSELLAFAAANGIDTGGLGSTPPQALPAST